MGSKKILFVLLIGVLFLIPIVAFDSNAAVKKNEEVQDVCGGGLYSNPKNSFVMSALSMCLPGVLEKTQEWKDIKCQAVVCKYEAVKNDLDPSFCTKQEQYQTCTVVVGEVFALPGFAMAENIRNVISELLRNPVGYLWSELAKAAREYMRPCQSNVEVCKSWSHGATAVFLAFTDISGVAQTLDEIKEFGFKRNRIDACEQLDDIRDELEQIVEVRG